MDGADDHRRMPPLLPITAEGARMLLAMKNHAHKVRSPVGFTSTVQTAPADFDHMNSSLVPGERRCTTNSRTEFENGKEATQESFHKRFKPRGSGVNDCVSPGYIEGQPEDLSVASNVFDINICSRDLYSGQGEGTTTVYNRQTGTSLAQKAVAERLELLPSQCLGEVIHNWKKPPETTPNPGEFSTLNQRDVRPRADCGSNGSFVSSPNSNREWQRQCSIRHGNIDDGCHYMTSCMDPNSNLVASNEAKANTESYIHGNGNNPERLYPRNNECDKSYDNVRTASDKSPQSQQRPAHCIILDQHTPTQLLKWEKQIEEMTRNAKLNRGAQQSNISTSQNAGTPHTQMPTSYGADQCRTTYVPNHVQQQRSVADRQHEDYRNTRRVFHRRRSRFSGATSYQRASGFWEQVSDDGSLYIKNVSEYTLH